LLHSLRWRDQEHDGACIVRVFAAMAWAVHSFAWAHSGAGFFHTFSIGAIVLAIWWARWFVFRKKSEAVVPVAAGLVAACSPANLAIVRLQTVPAGVIIISASFLLFALGTAAALTRHRWLRD